MALNVEMEALKIKLNALSAATLATVSGIDVCLDQVGTFVVNLGTTTFTTKALTTFTVDNAGAVVVGGAAAAAVVPALVAHAAAALGVIPFAPAAGNIIKTAAGVVSDYIGGVALARDDTVTIYGAVPANTITFTVTRNFVDAANPGQFTLSKTAAYLIPVFGGRKRSSKSRRRNHKSKNTRSKKTRQSNR